MFIGKVAKSSRRNIPSFFASKRSYHTCLNTFQATTPNESTNTSTAATPITNTPTQSVNNTTTNSSVPPINPTSSSNNNNKKGSSFGLYLTGLLGGVLAGAGYYAYLQKNKGELKNIKSSLQNKIKTKEDELKNSDDLEKRIKQLESQISNIKNSKDKNVEDLKNKYDREKENILKQLNDEQNENVNRRDKLNQLVLDLQKIQQELKELTSEKDLLLKETNQVKEQYKLVQQVEVKPKDEILTSILGRKLEENEFLEEDKDKLLSAIQRLENRLIRAERSLEQIKLDRENKLKELQVLNEEMLKKLREEGNADINNLEKRKEAVKELNERVIEQLREDMLNDLDKKLQLQAHDLLIQYYDNNLKRSQQLQELTSRVYAMEEVFDIASKNFTDTVDLQKFTSVLYSLKNVLELNASPFKPELDVLRKLGENDEVVKVVVNSIPEELSVQGVTRFEDLVERFKLVKRKAIESTLTPERSGFLGILYSKVASLFVVAEEGFVDGDTVNAILARTEFYLRQRRLSDAIQEIHKCLDKHKEHHTFSDSDIQVVLRDWVNEAQNRLIVDQAANVLSNHLVVLTHSIEQRKA
ncbi:hypothetical protein ABK040_004750 [Willaertia magna]